jgi:hypothetical protein
MTFNLTTFSLTTQHNNKKIYTLHKRHSAYSVFMFSDALRSVVYTVIRLSVVMLNGLTLSIVYVEYHTCECHFAFVFMLSSFIVRVVIIVFSPLSETAVFVR